MNNEDYRTEVLELLAKGKITIDGHDIKTMEDKTKVLSYVGHIPMYAKKNVCKKCGYEF